MNASVDELKSAGYLGIQTLSTSPHHLVQPNGDSHSFVYALWSLTRGRIVPKTRIDEMITSGFTSVQVVRSTLVELKLSYVTLPSSGQLIEEDDVDIGKCFNLRGFLGFLVCTQEAHYFAYVKYTNGFDQSIQIYNCDSREVIPGWTHPILVPSIRQLRQDLVGHRCKGCSVMAIFDSEQP